MDLYDPFGFVVCETRLGRNGAAAYLGISLRTLDRWIKNDSAPLAARRALSWLTGRADGWRGFRFRGPEVITPTGDLVHRNQVDSLEWYTRLQRQIGRNEAIKDLGAARPKPSAGCACTHPGPERTKDFAVIPRWGG